MSEDYDLGKSEKALGKLYPILKDVHGNIIDGFHRQNTDPDWPTVTVDSVDSPQKLELARLAVNFCRRNIPASEIQNRIVFLVGKCGMKPDEIAEKTGISLSTIYRHMPQELKDETKVEAKLGKVSDVTRQQTVTIPDMIECERCHVSTSDAQEWHGHALCPKCKERADLNPEAYDGYFRYREKESNGQTPNPKLFKPSAVDSWSHREAQMHPQHSKMEELILQRLDIKPVVTDRSFCLQDTTPDLFFPSLNLAVYLDGPVHDGREDRDEALSELLVKRHGLKVFRIKYSGESEKEQLRVLKEIAEKARA